MLVSSNLLAVLDARFKDEVCELGLVRRERFVLVRWLIRRLERIQKALDDVVSMWMGAEDHDARFEVSD